MIVDHIDNARKYYALGGKFEAVFDKLRECFGAQGEDENISVGRDSTISVQSGLELRNRDCLYEFHKKYIDVHLCLKNKEIIGYSGRITSLSESLNEKDYYLAQGDFAGEVELTEGMFALFFTGELHKPLLGDRDSRVNKCVTKILSDADGA